MVLLYNRENGSEILFKELRSTKMICYSFDYTCQYCGRTSRMRYTPPSQNKTVKLSCKNCERPILSILQQSSFLAWSNKYKVYDIVNKMTVLSDSNLAGSYHCFASRSVFLSWIVDHNGERIDTSDFE